MSSANRYDVTTWPVGDAAADIGEVINSIIADIKGRQRWTDAGGLPGAVISIPPGDYRLRTQVVIDLSFLRIEGSGHGFTSSSIRFNLPEAEWPDLHELWPGGSRILVDRAAAAGEDESVGSAFLVAREGDPRLSSIEFANFCIDGQHFVADSSILDPENSYTNGKTGIHVATANDSLRVTGMGFVYLEHAVTIYDADALSIHDNFIAECGNCVELRGWGQASKVTDNHIGAGPRGHSISAQNHGGLLIGGNNVFPRGNSSVHLEGVTRSSVTGNRLHSFYPGMLLLEAGSAENLIASNHFLRDREPWLPFIGVDNGREDTDGLVRVDGSGNSIIGNHFSEVVDSRGIRPAGTKPVIIRLVAGEGNYIATNHVVAKDVRASSGGSAFEAQVDALLATSAGGDLAVTTVLVDPVSTSNTILDSGRADQVMADVAANAVRFTPAVGS